jgi:hypothetical protein
MKNDPTEGKARYVYRRWRDELWEVGYHDEDGRWIGVKLANSPEAAAKAACRLNGHEPDVYGGGLFGSEVEER